jgi:hypothetical protein
VTNCDKVLTFHNQVGSRFPAAVTLTGAAYAAYSALVGPGVDAGIVPAVWAIVFGVVGTWILFRGVQLIVSPKELVCRSAFRSRRFPLGEVTGGRGMAHEFGPLGAWRQLFPAIGGRIDDRGVDYQEFE